MINEKLLNNFADWEQLLFTEGFGLDVCEEYLSFNKKVIICDCDGILTDGGHYYTEDGKTMKRFGSCDKEAMRFMLACGWKILFVTNDPSGYQITERRLKDWDVIKYYISFNDLEAMFHTPNIAKFIPFVGSERRANLIEAFNKDGFYTVFLGDSMSDLTAAKNSNLFCTTNNAIDLVKSYAQIVSNKMGGFGGFADLMYQIHWYVGSQYGDLVQKLEKNDKQPSEKLI